MRVVHFSTLHQSHDVRIFHKECRTLVSAGHDVHFLVTEAPASPVDGVCFHPLDKSNLRFRPARICRRLLNVYRQAAALHGDLYHFHDPELIVVGLLLKCAGFRVVYDVHEDAPREAVSLNKDRPWNGRIKAWAFAFLESAARRAFDGFVCATAAIARKFPSRHTVTFQNYPLLEEFAEPLPSYRGLTLDLVYIGGLSRIRGAVEMVRMLEQLPESLPVRLQIAGSVHPPDLLGELEQLPGWRRATYLGVLDRPAVRQLLGRAQAGLVLFHPEQDHLEAMPNKLLEYMAAGLPVIASDFPLWKTIVEGIGCGYTANPLDPAAIAAAVHRLLEEPLLAQAMGQRGRTAVRERFNWQPEARKLLALYEALEAA